MTYHCQRCGLRPPPLAGTNWVDGHLVDDVEDDCASALDEEIETMAEKTEGPGHEEMTAAVRDIALYAEEVVGRLYGKRGSLEAKRGTAALLARRAAIRLEDKGKR